MSLSESQQPLLGQHSSNLTAASDSLPGPGWTEDAPAVSVTPLEAIKKHNVMDRSALVVQASALLFAATVWQMVLSAMPLTNLPLFGYHPLLQSLGLIVVVQSILVLQPTSQANPSAKKAALTSHQVLNLLLMLPLFTAGAAIMWELHDKPGAKHFISWHGTLGFAFVCVAWLQAAAGAASVWFNGKLLGGENKAKGLWKYHRLSGYIILPLGLIVLYLGAAHTTWSQQNSSTAHHVLVLLSLGGVALAGARRINTTKLPKLKA